MRKKTNKSATAIAALALALSLTACTDDLFNGPAAGGDDAGKISLAGEIHQAYTTRVNDQGFCDGDRMGVYIVDYDGNTPGTLKPEGNRGDNVMHTFDEAAYKWNSAYDVFWKDKHTPIDVYGYYPFASPESIEAYAFTVERDQSTEAADGKLGGYEASDFLWGKAENIAPTTSVIRLPMRHRMANARVTLVEGTGFAAGEWAQTEKTVLATNLIRKATINMATGKVTAAGQVERTATVPSKRGDEWRAIVVPQTVTAGTTLFSITIGGVPYKFSKQEAFSYTPGKMSNFAIRVDKKAESGQYQLTLISESITAWEADMVSHDANGKEYIIIESTPGHLQDSIAAAHKDHTLIKNMKIKGGLSNVDFDFMREKMTNLQNLNLKEADMYYYNKHVSDTPERTDKIPEFAFAENTTLTHIDLPDNLKEIGLRAFENCKGLTGSLIIPDGVVRIEHQAFYNCENMTGSLTLPDNLEYIGERVFSNCGFNSELKLPSTLTYIGWEAFGWSENFYGSLILPDNITYIGRGAFYSCKNITGDLKIPQSLTKINSEVFGFTGFNGNLILHDGITYIGNMAFMFAPFKGELNLPNSLTIIERDIFYGCKFSGELKLPKTLVSIGDNAFFNNNFSGTLEFPEGLQTIGNGTFQDCERLEKIVLPASIENIGSEAFLSCSYIGGIVCKGDMPARLANGTFDGVAKDNFTLEVPENSVAQYQTAPGWCDFKRIAAHHELVCRPQAVCALNQTRTQTLVIDAEGDWEVASKPDWCEVQPTSGSKKTEVTLTVKQLAKGSGDREGELVFRLKEKDYTHTCKVKQSDYQYDEDEYLTLQQATKGNTGGISLVFLGDGYNSTDIASGKYLEDIKQQVEHFFGIEPYRAYREYFNVYTAFPLSTESGVGTVNTIRYNRFETTFSGGVGLQANYNEIFSYALNAPTVTENNLDQTLIVIIPNTTEYGGRTTMWESGSAIAFCPMSTNDYPYDSRGLVQHEAGGHGFGKLGDEYIYHNAFITNCNCTCCGHVNEVNHAKAIGWYDNLDLTGKMHEVGWSHLIFHPKYSGVVDIFEGGYMHTRGVFRSEQNSCMNNNVPYYSTISRESIVKRIKRYAGEEYSFEDFVANDVMDAGNVTRNIGQTPQKYTPRHQMPPRIMKGSPLPGVRKYIRNKQNKQH